MTHSSTSQIDVIRIAVAADAVDAADARWRSWRDLLKPARFDNVITYDVNDAHNNSFELLRARTAGRAADDVAFYRSNINGIIKAVAWH